MSEESEEQVRESRAPYAATVEAPVEEHILDQLRVQFPPYFDRFLEERDRRLSSELGRLEAAIEHNGAEITRLRAEMGRRFTQAKEEREALRTEMDRRFVEAREEREALQAEIRTEVQSLRTEMDRRFVEAREEREALRAEMDRRFVEAREEREALWAEMDRRFVEAREERKLLRAEIHSQFRWTIGLLFPLVAGMLAIIIRVFLVGTF